MSTCSNASRLPGWLASREPEPRSLSCAGRHWHYAKPWALNPAWADIMHWNDGHFMAVPYNFDTPRHPHLTALDTRLKVTVRLFKPSDTLTMVGFKGVVPEAQKGKSIPVEAET